MTKAAVIGLGTMGPGIAATLARAGIAVTAFDADAGQRAKAAKSFDMAGGVLGRLGVAQQGAPAPIDIADSLAQAVAGADLVVETVPEKLDLKIEVFRQDTCLPMPEPLKGRKIMVVADEDVAKLWPAAPAFTWIYDITEERCPIPIATFQVPGLDKDGSPQPPMMGCHQPSERFTGTVIPFAWFAQGLRVLDIADPFAPKEVAYYKPNPPAGFELASSNDVTMDRRGLCYLIDRQRGVDIIETSGL